MKRKLLILVIALVGDWLSKWLVFQWGFERKVNSGVSFGVGGNALVVVGLLVMALVGYKYRRMWGYSGWWLMLGGVVANLGERIVTGRVSDWIFVGIAGLWFNLADVFIMLGCSLILWRESKIKA